MKNAFLNDTSMDDKLIYVDIFDNQTGSGIKIDAHREGRLHRAFSVFICHEGQMLIQKRATGKYHSGGLWANTCCSHPRDGEETLAAAQRRLIEEVGINCENLKEIDSFVYFHKFRDDLYEYEFDHIIIGDYYGCYMPNPNEIAEMKWIDYFELARDLAENPENYSVWFLIAAPKVLAYLKKQGIYNY